MFLMQAYIQSEDHKTKRAIEKLQRQRNSGEINDSEYEEKYETVMQDFRLQFAQIMDGRSWQAYNTYNK